MSDPFSIAAAAVSLLDVAIKASREVASLISAMKNAPEDLLRIHSKVAQFESLTQQLWNLRQAYTASSLLAANQNAFRLMHSTLDQSVKDLDELRNKLEQPIRQTDPAIRRFWKRVKHPFKEPAICKIAARLDTHISMVSGALAIIGRTNDIVVLNSIDRGVQQQARAHLELTTTIQHAEHRIQNRLDEVHSNMPTWLETPVLLQGGSATQAAAALSMLQSYLRPLIQGVSAQHAVSGLLRWIDPELNTLFSGAHRLAARELEFRNASSGLPRGRRRPLQSASTQVRYHVDEQTKNTGIVAHQSRTSSRFQVDTQVKIEKELPVGHISLVISTRSDTDGQFAVPRCEGINLLFCPKPEFGIDGVAASFVRTVDLGVRIPPCLSTFRVIPGGSPALKAIKIGDVAMVKTMLANGQLHPRDRDMNGNSVLMRALYYFNHDICELLLEEGADPMDCDRRGNSALIYFVNVEDIRKGQVFSSESEMTRTLRMLVRRCGLEATQAVCYHNFDGSSYYSEDDLLAVILNGTEIDYAILRYFLSQCDLEQVDLIGRTPLLRAASLPASLVAPTINVLLHAGANAQAVDQYGEGVLRRWLAQISSCNPASLDVQTVESITRTGAELLRRGCDPNLVDISGFTPSERALLPASWSLWCQTLCAAGLDVQEAMGKDDAAFGVVWNDHVAADGFLENASGPCVIPDGYFNVEYCNATITCSICGGPSRRQLLRFPFDMISSKINFGLGRHWNFSYNHPDGAPCGNLSTPGSCAREDHYSDGYPLFRRENLSIRKWAACRLWEEGYLNTPREAYEWAANVMTQEAIDSWGHLAFIWPSALE